MIAKLTGTITDIFSDYTVLEVNGVGYRVESPAQIGLEGEEVSVFTYMHVREQEIRIFGFPLKKELLLFEKLLTVSGVGPKVALALISNLGAEKVIFAVESKEEKMLKSPGVGVKTAARIVVDLKSKLAASGLTSEGKITTEQSEVSSKETEIAGALSQLGYSKDEITQMIDRIDLDGGDIDTLIKQALSG
ncbi:MAG: Holliday junction branch migration protein RuvA [Candidatus Dojkabacteria bacterium]